MAIPEVSLRGVKRRNPSGPCYFGARYGDGRFYCTKIKSREEGALCYDIVQRYKKRKATVKLNYPEYSRSLQLEPLPTGFDIQNLKDREEAMEIILKQARAAVKNLPEGRRRSTPVVGSPNRSLSHQNVRGKPLVAKQDLPGLCTNQLNLPEISELLHLCNMFYTSKVIEKGELRIKMEDIDEDSGIIYGIPPESCPGNFTSIISRIEQHIENVKQGYKSHSSECLELRKSLGDHNLKVIDEFLMSDENDSSGRQRANEDERLPRLPEDCPSKEQHECGVSVLDSDGYGPPGNPRC